MSESNSSVADAFLEKLNNAILDEWLKTRGQFEYCSKCSQGRIDHDADGIATCTTFEPSLCPEFKGALAHTLYHHIPEDDPIHAMNGLARAAAMYVGKDV